MTTREVGRRLIHIALGGGAFLLPYLGTSIVSGLCLVAMVGNLFLLPRLRATNWILRDGQNRGLRGVVLYPAVVLVLVLVAQERYALAQAGWLALAVGDGTAPFAGQICPYPRWPWQPAKSIPATLSAFSLAALVMSLVIPWPLAIAAGLGGAIGDCLPDPSEDNFATPASAALAYAAAGLAFA